MIQIDTGCNNAQTVMKLSNGIHHIDIAFDKTVIDEFVLLLNVLCIKPDEIIAIEDKCMN